MSWESIPGHDGYEVCEDGTVRNAKSGRILKPRDNCSGYLQLRLGRGPQFFVHRLVAITFLGQPAPEMKCDHIDRNPRNNHVSNLRWVTHGENMKNADPRWWSAKPDGLPHHISRHNSGFRVRIQRTDMSYTRTFPTLEEAVEERDRILETC